MEQKKYSEIEDIGTILLHIGSDLMSSGASSNRIRITIDRIANAYGYNADLLITNRALMITVEHTETEEIFSRVKRTNPHTVNFKLVSGISKMSWKIVEEKWTFQQIKNKLTLLHSLSHYPRIIVLTFVALAGASFCRLFGGNAIDMGVTFVATFAGLFIRQEALKRNFNLYLCILFASLTASLISGFAYKLALTETIEHAFAASVLFLVPGVPLINSFSDIIDGNFLNGIARSVNAIVMIFMIALGLFSAMLIYNL